MFQRFDSVEIGMNTMDVGDRKVERFRYFSRAGLVVFGLLPFFMVCLLKVEKAKNSYYPRSSKVT